MKKLFISIVFTNLLLFACNDNNDVMKYKAKRIDKRIRPDAVWDKEPWTGIKALTLKNYMGDKPKHFPLTKAKVAYDDEAIYVIFRVEDQYVRAVVKENQGPVFRDSCVEFFFSPDGDRGYFNLEMNCGGTMLFHHQIKPRESVHIDEELIEKVEVAHSLPKIVDPEIEEPVTWTVEYRIPFSILKKYADFITPEAGTVWRANFYKIADKTSHPHWLTWSPVQNPEPNFHLPQYFGEIEF